MAETNINAKKSANVPVGLRNFNPGNIRYDGRTMWQGLAKPPQDALGFCRFIAPQWGIRAIGKLLLTYKNKYNVASVRAFVNRYAPPSENNTESYVEHVAKVLGVDPDDYIELDDYATAYKLTEVIIKHENGRQPYSKKVIDEGLYKAGIHDAPKAGLFASSSAKAQAVGLGMAATGAVAPYAEPMTKAAAAIAPMSEVAAVNNVRLFFLTLAAACVLAGLIFAWLKNRKGL